MSQYVYLGRGGCAMALGSSAAVCLYTGFLLFSYLLCMCGLWMCPRLCVSKCAWRPEVDFECLPQSLSTLFLETESLIEPGPCPLKARMPG